MAYLSICFASCNDEALVETSQPEATGQSFRLIAKQQSPSRLALDIYLITFSLKSHYFILFFKKTQTYTVF
jgi:hypothetical protein